MINKITIFGSGAVGSTLAFHLLSRLTIKQLIIADIVQDLAKGTACDLEDTREFLNFNTEIIGTKDFSQIKDSNIVVITAGIARKDGMSRLDLLKINAGVVKDLSRHIKQHAPNAVIIVVTNPLDIITYLAVKETGFDYKRVLGMGASLDTARLLNLLHKEMKISIAALQGYVFGTHSNDMIVSPERIFIKGQNINAFLKSDSIENLRKRTQGRGAEIVGYLKNRSASFAPSLSCCRLIEAIVNDTNQIIPVSTMLNGEYGISNMCIGVPCVINAAGIAKIIEVELSAFEKQEIAKAKALFDETLKSLQ